MNGAPSVAIANQISSLLAGVTPCDWTSTRENLIDLTNARDPMVEGGEAKLPNGLQFIIALPLHSLQKQMKIICLLLFLALSFCWSLIPNSDNVQVTGQTCRSSHNVLLLDLLKPCRLMPQNHRIFLSSGSFDGLRTKYNVTEGLDVKFTARH